MGVGLTTGTLSKRLSAAVASLLQAIPGMGFNGPDQVRPVFIVGSGRSGTTLLRRMLMEGGQIHIPPESYVLGTVIRKFAVWRLLPWRLAVRRVLSEFERHPEFRRFELSLRPVESALEDSPPRSRTLATMIDAIYRRHSAEMGNGESRWGDKTPLNAYALPDIHRVFPNAQFVHMLRDGCDVVSSMLEMGRYATVEEAALRWTTSVDAIRRFGDAHPESMIEIRYENLAAQPEVTLRPLCQWLKIDYREEMVSSTSTAVSLGDVPALGHHHLVLAPITSSRIGRGRCGLDEASQQRLQRLLGGTLQAMGYPPVFPASSREEGGS